MAIIALWIGEGGFSEVKFQASFAFCGSAGWLLPENFQKKSLQAR